jgi:hypothetical protein
MLCTNQLSMQSGEFLEGVPVGGCEVRCDDHSVMEVAYQEGAPLVGRDPHRQGHQPVRIRWDGGGGGCSRVLRIAPPLPLLLMMLMMHRSILTEIHLCHACSDHDIEDAYPPVSPRPATKIVRGLPRPDSGWSRASDMSWEGWLDAGLLDSKKASAAGVATGVLTVPSGVIEGEFREPGVSILESVHMD